MARNGVGHVEHYDILICAHHEQYGGCKTIGCPSAHANKRATAKVSNQNYVSTHYPFDGWILKLSR